MHAFRLLFDGIPNQKSYTFGIYVHYMIDHEINTIVQIQNPITMHRKVQLKKVKYHCDQKCSDGVLTSVSTKCGKCVVYDERSHDEDLLAKLLIS